MSVMFCKVSKPSFNASSSWLSVSQAFFGATVLSIRWSVPATFVLSLPLWGVPRKRMAWVETNIEWRCAMFFDVLLAEYAKAWQGSQYNLRLYQLRVSPYSLHHDASK